MPKLSQSAGITLLKLYEASQGASFLGLLNSQKDMPLWGSYLV